MLRQAAQHRAAQVPDELGRQLHLQLHGDALLARQLKGQPAAHALARHHHQRRGKGVAEWLGKQARGQFAKGFEVRGVVEAEHEGGFDWISGQG